MPNKEDVLPTQILNRPSSMRVRSRCNQRIYMDAFLIQKFKDKFILQDLKLRRALDPGHIISHNPTLQSIGNLIIIELTLKFHNPSLNNLILVMKLKISALDITK